MGGELKNKQKVTLTLDKEVYRRARELAVVMPGGSSISALVDELLDQFVTTMTPVYQDLLVVRDAPAQIAALKRVHGELSTLIGLELADTIRAVETASQQKEGST